MRVLIRTLFVLASCACSQAAKPSSERVLAAGAAAMSGDAGVAASAPIEATDNGHDVLLATPPPLPPVAGTRADLPFAACEPGKFCRVQTRGEEDCGTFSLTHSDTDTQLPGNLLIVFDQSLSMNETWAKTGQSKLQAAQTAIARAIDGLKDSVHVGALFFPTQSCSARQPSPPGGAVAAIDKTPQINFTAAATFLDSWAQHWQSQARRPSGTPLQEALDRADDALRALELSNAMKPVAATAVVVVTDGEPNCVPSDSPSLAPAKRAQSWLADRQIKTYVVGLPGAAGVALLNDIAANGGSSSYLLPDDPTALEAQLVDVVKSTVLTTFQACTITLEPATTKPEGLQLLVVEASDGQKHHIAQQVMGDSGWRVSGDGAHVELLGQLCTDAQTGRFRAITFEYACDPHVPPPERQPSPQ